MLPEQDYRDGLSAEQLVRTLQSLLAAERAAMRLTCRYLGCRRRRYVDVHHITYRSDGGEHSRKNCVCLCTTHHALLHDGRLRIEGDADAELRFFDAGGAPLSLPASQRGTPPVPAPPASQGGAPAVAVAGGADKAATLLALMGHRGGWTVDALVEASGLGVTAVHVALLDLELDGRVAFDRQGTYARRATPG